MIGKARVLFVDDEKRVLNSMRGLFRRDFELFLTTEGAAAVRIAAESPIDVVVADQRMPGMTGIEVLGKVKELSPRTIRILLTGYADQNAVEGSINIGEVFRFLSKPCPPQLLRETLDLAVAAARATPAASAVTAAATHKPATMPDGEEKQPIVYAERPSTTDLPVLKPTARKGGRSTPPAPESGRPDFNNDASSSHWNRVTDVVLSGESSKESKPAEISAHTVAMTKDVGVVVFTVDPQFAEAAIRAVSTERSTMLATTLAKVAQAVEQHQAGVMVTDFTTKSAVLQKIISALKQYRPELVTIVVSGTRDTTDMISLINYGQVFRYILKPVDSQSLRNDINAAAIRHIQLLNNPALVKRHHVGTLAGPSDSSQTLNEFVSRIRNSQTGPVKPIDKSS